MVGQAAVRAEIHRNWLTAQRAEILREIESSLLISFDFDELQNLLIQGLTRLESLTFIWYCTKSHFHLRGGHGWYLPTRITGEWS